MDNRIDPVIQRLMAQWGIAQQQESPPIAPSPAPPPEINLTITLPPLDLHVTNEVQPTPVNVSNDVVPAPVHIQPQPQQDVHITVPTEGPQEITFERDEMGRIIGAHVKKRRG